MALIYLGLGRVTNFTGRVKSGSFISGWVESSCVGSGQQKFQVTLGQMFWFDLKVKCQSIAKILPFSYFWLGQVKITSHWDIWVFPVSCVGLSRQSRIILSWVKTRPRPTLISPLSSIIDKWPYANSLESVQKKSDFSRINTM